MHGRGRGGRAAVIHSRRAGERGLRRPRRVVGRLRSCRITSLARAASKEGGALRSSKCAWVYVVAPARSADHAYPQQREKRQARSAL
eukprot:1308924-Pleurochrysis_carterae.AAC.1